MHNKVVNLERKETEMQVKIENEKKRLEEMNKVRERFEAKVRDLKEYAHTREVQLNETLEKNFNSKLQSQQQKIEKLFECYAYKKEARDEVRSQNTQLLKQSEHYNKEINSIKHYNASIIKQQASLAKEKNMQNKNQQDQLNKMYYLGRIDEAMKRKDTNDKQLDTLMSKE